MKKLALFAITLGLAITLVAPYQSARAADCRFVLGFKAIHDLIPDKVGECLVNEHYNPENGDALQETTGGLLVWRKADNFTAFTDGYRSWVNGPFGLQQRLNSERFEWEPLDPQLFVLTPGDMPPGFRLAPTEARYNSNETIAAGYKDKQAALNNLHRFGRVNGYYIAFRRDRTESMIGAELVVSQAIVHVTPEGAQAYMEHYVTRQQENLPQSRTMEDVIINKIGDESKAVRYVERASATTSYWTQYDILFRKGNVYCIVMAQSLTGAGLFDEAVRFAKVMESRIK